MGAAAAACLPAASTPAIVTPSTPVVAAPAGSPDGVGDNADTGLMSWLILLSLSPPLSEAFSPILSRAFPPSARPLPPSARPPITSAPKSSKDACVTTAPLAAAMTTPDELCLSDLPAREAAGASRRWSIWSPRLTKVGSASFEKVLGLSPNRPGSRNCTSSSSVEPGASMSLSAIRFWFEMTGCARR